MFRFIKKAAAIVLTAILAILFLLTFDDEPESHNHHTHATITQKPIPVFFQSKTITPNGIFPLPSENLNDLSPIKPSRSVIPDRFYDLTVTNPHDFEWLINPYQTCTENDEVFLLVTIATASWEFKRREIIRTTWTSFQPKDGKIIKYLFFVATDRRGSISEVLKDESKLYNDLVHEDFQETYKNLTLKTIGQLKWAVHFCPNAKYVMHVDDDVFAQIPDIVTHLEHQEEEGLTDRQMYCSKVFMPVVRRDGKWTMSEEDYPGPPNLKYPLGCVGWCFVMTFDVVKDLYYMALKTHHIHLEDVTVTGILREKIGLEKVSKLPGDEKYCQHLGWPKDKPVEDKLKNSYKEYHEMREH